MQTARTVSQPLTARGMWVIGRRYSVSSRADLAGSLSKVMCMSRIARMVLMCLASVPLVMMSARQTAADSRPLTLVFLNGVPSAVSFNDGDSFKVIQGNPKDTNARLSGFNTLESHGPVHRWGGWEFKELYANAKMATLNARRGVWHCDSDMSADGYGRILWHCPDLAEDQIRKGLAHAMSVTSEPAESHLLAAQHEAMREHRGMWAKGVPTYVMTSLHSADEARDKSGPVYNRLINTVDGHTLRWAHTRVYKECESVCHWPVELPIEEARQVAVELRRDPEVRQMIQGMTDTLVALSVNTFLQRGSPPRVFGENQEKFAAVLEGLKESGRFSGARRLEGSCGIHVIFERRYKRPKPVCLKW